MNCANCGHPRCWHVGSKNYCFVSARQSDENKFCACAGWKPTATDQVVSRPNLSDDLIGALAARVDADVTGMPSWKFGVVDALRELIAVRKDLVVARDRVAVLEAQIRQARMELSDR